jgi:large subunit ribosomal protein L3
MLKEFLGKKIGMTQVFSEAGGLEPVTIIEAGPCSIVQVKTGEKHGYEAIQLGYGKLKHANKPMAGHLGSSLHGRHLREVEVEGIGEYEVGQEVLVDMFAVGEKVTITGTSKGKGFAGTVKRWGFHGGPKTHGQSDRHRAPGSIGAGTTPGKVYKGQKMSGHMGNRQITVKNLEILLIDAERNLIAVKGGIPGARNSMVTIKRTGLYGDTKTLLGQELEDAIEAVVEETTEAVAEETTEAVVEETTEAVVEETTEAVAEETTEAVVEETTEAVTEETIEAVAEETTEEEPNKED